ncbi:hypothetical protein Elgi_36830 [Paenibacillus elgii]|uniref:hypothetical protein n=1 Tax=Paenibacillus elgii TaxID=189691 RepID=UPI002D7A9E38|nr:hypothetical protein Elgi_36830 [Paenibacillus elgii]
MKQFVATAVGAAMLFTLASGVSADAVSAGQNTNPPSVSVGKGADSGRVIEPMAELVNQHINFSGQGYAHFKYSNTSGPEEVRTFVKNIGSTAFTFRLKDPSGNVWQEVQLDPDKSYTSTYTLDKQHSGTWNYEFNNKDGGNGQAWISARSGV